MQEFEPQLHQGFVRCLLCEYRTAKVLAVWIEPELGEMLGLSESRLAVVPYGLCCSRFDRPDRSPVQRRRWRQFMRRFVTSMLVSRPDSEPSR